MYESRARNLIREEVANSITHGVGLALSGVLGKKPAFARLVERTEAEASEKTIGMRDSAWAKYSSRLPKNRCADSNIMTLCEG